ncbi:glycosyltransferase family 2 protein [Listeria booriae]|uniref:glycosyltransferase family 2 protein n=1 Tax=Listeria booriae TaxID=1552123 RepID=UPI0017A46632|nr:glycosyltransferase family 2 protein [Listeria booriae]MBC2304415.1 glycosyltransferase family 2 protein [Listeria booriae]
MRGRYDNQLVSIIMPCFNAMNVIGDSIDSVLAQTYADWELIIVDDASADQSLAAIEPYLTDPRIQLLAKEKNEGVALARNDGLTRSTGRYVAFLDSDDLWRPHKLEQQLTALTEKDAVLSYSAYETFQESPLNPVKVIQVPESITYQELLKNTIIGCLTVVIDRHKTGAFEMPNLPGGEDTATWLNILRENGVAYGIQEPLAYYRTSGSSLSGNKLKMVRRTWRMYRETQQLSIFGTCICFSFYIKNAIVKRI